MAAVEKEWNCIKSLDMKANSHYYYYYYYYCYYYCYYYYYYYYYNRSVDPKQLLLTVQQLLL